MDTAIRIEETAIAAGADCDLLRLMTWLSPSFPVGAFSYSHGLEFAVEAGRVADKDALVDWVGSVIARGAGRLDGALFVRMHRAMATNDTAEFDEIVARADAMRGSSEMARESAAQGEAFLATIRAVWPDARLDGLANAAVAQGRPIAYAVAVAAVAAVHGIALAPALAAFLHATAANLVSAGVRLVPLGQTDGQRAMASLEPVILDTLAEVMARPFTDIGTASPIIDLASMQHETQYTRLFRS